MDLAGNLRVIGTFTGTSDVNLKQVNSATVAVGHGVAATAVRVELPTDGTGVVGLNASQNGIGNVGCKTVSITVTPTVTATNSYGTNYVVGGLLTFSNAFTSTGSGILQSVVVTCKKAESQGFTFFTFNANPTNTTWTDAAVAAINVADVGFLREPVLLNSNNQLSNTSACSVSWATGLGQTMAPGSTTMYGILLTNAALTNQFGSTSDITVTVKILQDL
jgi:hypothetical protein